MRNRFVVHHRNDIETRRCYEDVANVYCVRDYVYDPSTLRGKLKNWLQRKLWSWYKRLALVTQYQRERMDVSIHRVELDLDDIAKLLFEYGSLIEARDGHRVRTWVIGLKEYAKLANTHEQWLSPIGVEFPSNYRSPISVPTSVGIGRFSMSGLRIIVCPWVDGVIPIPEVEEIISPRLW